MYRIFVIFALFVFVRSSVVVKPLGGNGTLVTYSYNETVVSSDPPVTYQRLMLNESVPVSVACEALFSGGSTTVVWYREGKELTVKDFGRNNDIMEVKTQTSSRGSNSTLTVHKPTSAHAAAYTCKFTVGTTSSNASVYINSPPLIQKFDKAKRAIQGDKLKVTCIVAGYPKPDRVYWYFQNLSNEWTGRDGASLQVNGDIQDSKLLFTSLQFEDRGIYYCRASNSLGEDIAGVLVRAKNRLDALWPFLCIVAEVAILVTIILIYEKKRSNVKKPADVNGAAVGADNKEEEEAGDAETKDGDKEEVRQRSVKA